MATIEITKEAWVDTYSERILLVWQQLQGPLGIDDQYSQQVKDQLDDFFDDPLKRSLIETTYTG